LINGLKSPAELRGYKI